MEEYPTKYRRLPTENLEIISVGNFRENYVGICEEIIEGIFKITLRIFFKGATFFPKDI